MKRYVVNSDCHATEKQPLQEKQPSDQFSNTRTLSSTTAEKLQLTPTISPLIRSARGLRAFAASPPSVVKASTPSASASCSSTVCVGRDKSSGFPFQGARQGGGNQSRTHRRQNKTIERRRYCYSSAAAAERKSETSKSSLITGGCTQPSQR